MAFISCNYIRKEGREGCSCVLLLFFQDFGFAVLTMATNRSLQQAKQTHYCLSSPSKTFSQCQSALARSILRFGVRWSGQDRRRNICFITRMLIYVPQTILNKIYEPWIDPCSRDASSDTPGCDVGGLESTNQWGKEMAVGENWKTTMVTTWDLKKRLGYRMPISWHFVGCTPMKRRCDTRRRDGHSWRGKYVGLYSL